MTCLVADHGCVCHVVVPGDGPLLPRLAAAGAETLVGDFPWWCDWEDQPEEAPGRRLARGAVALVRLLPRMSDIDPDLVFTQSLVTPWGAVAAALLGKPHVWSVCEYGERDYGFRFFVPFPQVLATVRRSSALVLTASRAVRDDLFGADDPGCVPLARAVAVAPAAGDEAHPFRRPGALRLALVGSVCAAKGQETAILAVAELLRRGVDAELVLAGAPIEPYAERMRQLVDTTGLATRVRFVGLLDDVGPLLRASDVVLVCSRCEAFGRAAAEAASVGKPLICPATGGLPEVAIEGVNALWYRGGPGDLADKIALLAGDPELRRRLGEGGRAHVAGRYDRETVSRALGELLPPLKGRPGAPAGLLPVMAAALGQRSREGETAAGAAERLALELAACVDELAAATARAAELRRQAVAAAGDRDQLALRCERLAAEARSGVAEREALARELAGARGAAADLTRQRDAALAESAWMRATATWRWRERWLARGWVSDAYRALRRALGRGSAGS